VEDIIVYSANKTLDVGGTQTITAQVLPSTATNKNITWESDDPSVASVNSYGRVTAMSGGVAVITAVTKDGGFWDSLQITVNEEVYEEEYDEEYEEDYEDIYPLISESDLYNLGMSFSRIHRGNVGSTLNTDYFSWRVRSARGGNETVTADISVNNNIVSDEEIVIGSYEFFIAYLEYDGSVIEDYGWGTFPDEAWIEPGGSVSGTLSFGIPLGVKKVFIAYCDWYDNIYYYTVNL
jgi:hypothetical protein